MSLWKLGSCQCFATPEVSASFGDHETIDISFDVGSLSEKILTDLITTSDQIPKNTAWHLWRLALIRIRL